MKRRRLGLFGQVCSQRILATSALSACFAESDDTPRPVAPTP